MFLKYHFTFILQLWLYLVVIQGFLHMVNDTLIQFISDLETNGSFLYPAFCCFPRPKLQILFYGKVINQ